MPLSKALTAAPAIMLCFYQYSAFAQTRTPSSARLIFTHAEPIEQSVQVRDEKYKLVNLKMWFKNDGQSTARLHTIAIMPVLTDKVLTAAQEDNEFSFAATQWSVVFNGEVKPGQTVALSSQNGVDDQGWTDFQANRKYLYSFLSLSYISEDLGAQDETVTELCIWFQNGDVKTVNACQSDHNRVRKGAE